MRWVLVSRSNATLQEYHLLQDNECKAILKYNPLHRSARVSSGRSQRLFFIQSAGALTGKNIFVNEYGMEVGNLTLGKWNDFHGSLTIDDTKFYYSSKNAEINISDSSRHIVATCELNSSNASPVSKNSIENNYLLLGLCWYLYLPVIKEKLVFAA